mgnify:CR=1 FL=1
MKINIKATGIELTQAITDYVDKKISSIEKYIERGGNGIVVEVEVGKSTQHHKAGNVFRAEVHITGGRLDLYAVSEKEDLYAAIDVVRDEIVHNIVQSKEKRETLTRKGAMMMKYMMKGLSQSTARGFSWSIERLKFKNFKKRS